MSETPHEPDVADLNVERLVSQTYQPEAPAPDLLTRVERRMIDAAHEQAAVTLPVPEDDRLDRVRRRLGAVMGIAAAVAGVAIVMHALKMRDHGKPPADMVKNESTFDLAAQGLTPKPRTAVKPPLKFGVNQSIQTHAGERRRVALPDGSILYVNQNTSVLLEADRTLRLTSGELFVEVSPRGAAEPFVVRAPQREVKALGTKFAVNADGAGRVGVLVTQGKVKVSDVAEPLFAGEQLDPDKTQRSPAARASHLLNWTRELMAAAESPLVPDSKYSGGALVAVDPYGQEAKLSLRKYHVDVHIEDGFARTMIDQTYFNHNGWRMEGTFYFPLPADASLSRLAMYVGENLMEGGMAERDYARNVYEEIVTSQKDPALLEWVDGSTFKMRVFPLEARQEKRILIGYTQRLSSLYGRTQYRFPAGHSLNLVNEWKFSARIKDARMKNAAGEATDVLDYGCDSHTFKKHFDNNDLLLETLERNTKLDRDVVLELHDKRPGSLSQDMVRFSGMHHEGNRYLMLRYQPALQVEKRRQGRDWVFLFESSGDRDPLVARVQVDIIRALLANAEHDDTFAILSAGTRLHRFSPAALPVTPENVQAAIEFLERQHLVGALDLAQALSATAPLLVEARNPHLVHVGTGVAAIGERRIDRLALRVPPKARYVGVGVGKRWNRDFMKTAAERTGGYFTQINPDEPVTWRAFELAATLNTPRLMNVRVESGTTRFLTFGSALAQGEELCAVTRLAPGEAMPAKVTVHGHLDGRDFEQDIDVPPTAPEAGHLPRTWAKLEIERLLADTTHDQRPAIIELSKQMYVMTPYTSLLVLENDEMYRRFKVDRGRKDHWAPYPAPAKIQVVYEPEDGQAVDARFAPKTEKPHANQILETILVRLPAPMIVWPNRQQPYGNQQLTTALQVYHGAFGLPGMPVPAPMTVLHPDRPSNLSLINEALSDAELATNFSLDRAGDISLPGPVTMGRISVLMAGTKGKPDASNALEVMAASRAPGRSDHYSRNGSFFAGRNGTTRERMFLGDMGGELGRLSFGFDGSVMPVTEGLDLLREVEKAPSFRNGEGGRRRWTLTATPDPLPFIDAAPNQPTTPMRDSNIARNEGELAELVYGSSHGPPMYGRPSFSMDERIFFDLVAHAPGLNSSAADAEAIKEAEAAPSLTNAPGHIDAGARKLIEQARTGGWRSLTVGKGDGAYTVTFDGTGRYAYERTVSFGLKEQVVCDGATLLHLYPELGLGARRSMSRFHRSTLLDLVPWLVPPAEDLARGADVKLLPDGRTVNVVRRGAETAVDDDGKPVPYALVQLVFADSRLAERRIVGMPENTVLFRETYDAATGRVRLVNGDDKEISKRELKLADGKEPNLTPDTTKLVVMPLPYRQREHVYHVLGIDRNQLYNNQENWTFEYLDEQAATALFTAEVTSGDYGTARHIYHLCFAPNKLRKLGFFTLLATGNLPLSNDAEFVRAWTEHQNEPLARYLALHLNPRYRSWQQRWGLHLGETVGPENTFLRRLSDFHDLVLHWRNHDATWGTERARRAEQEHALAFVRSNKDNILGWAMLSVLQDRADDPRFHTAVAHAWKELDAGSDLSYVARYEHARGILRAGDQKPAAELFRQLYRQTLKNRVLPPIDHDFHHALQAGGEDVAWTALVRETADALLKDKQRHAVVTLAWQCWQLGDAPLAHNLLADALRNPADDVERLGASVAALEFLMGTNQPAEADALLQSLLAQPQFASKPMLWRLGARIADQRNLTAQSIASLEKALDLEYRDLPKVINLQQVRQDYGTLLNHYQWLAGAVTILKIDAPTDLAARTIRAADRWRALDREASQPCDAAARVLKTLGDRDGAWDYFTTPIGTKPNEAGPWRDLANSLSYQGDLDLADRAYRAAFEAEPTDAQLLWDRAQNLKRSGKLAEANKLLRQIVDDHWQPRFNWLKAQARWQLEGR
jgi:ferric-dicitrate binding protein FerR (iron transport regulator)/tetratricopeptide (TPR) repeat protein